MDNETKSNLPFTEEELKILNFTPEELEILEDSYDYIEIANTLPTNPTALIQKVEENFRQGEDVTVSEVFEKLGELAESDPEFIAQLVATQELLSACRPDDEKSESSK